MDYNKINKINTDGNGNIILQDVNSKSITINQSNSEELIKLLQSISDMQTFELKQQIGCQYKSLLDEIKKIQSIVDEQKTNTTIKNITSHLDDFFLQIMQGQINAAKQRLKENYIILREYEEILILETDPINKKKAIKSIEFVKNNIKNDIKELKSIK